MTTQNYQDKSTQELQAELQSLLREQFNLRMQRATGQLTRFHLLHNVRKNIARVRTVLTAKQNKGEAV